MELILHIFTPLKVLSILADREIRPLIAARLGTGSPNYQRGIQDEHSATAETDLQQVPWQLFRLYRHVRRAHSQPR